MVHFIDSINRYKVASAGTNTYSIELIDTNIVGAYMKNETTPCYAECYLRETDVTTSRLRHYLISTFLNNILEVAKWNGSPSQRANRPFYLVFVFKGCEASDQLYFGYSWEVKR